MKIGNTMPASENDRITFGLMDCVTAISDGKVTVVTTSYEKTTELITLICTRDVEVLRKCINDLFKSDYFNDNYVITDYLFERTNDYARTIEGDSFGDKFVKRFKIEIPVKLSKIKIKKDAKN